MLKLKVQYFGHLMQTDDSSEKSLMLEKIEGRREKGHHRIRWLDGITDAMDMNLGKLLEMVRHGETWHAAVHGFTKSGTRWGNWATTPALQADALRLSHQGSSPGNVYMPVLLSQFIPPSPAYSVSLGVVCWTAITYDVGRLGLPLHHLTPKHEHHFHTHFLGKTLSLGCFVKAAFSGNISALYPGCGCAPTQASGDICSWRLMGGCPIGHRPRLMPGWGRRSLTQAPCLDLGQFWRTVPARVPSVGSTVCQASLSLVNPASHWSVSACLPDYLSFTRSFNGEGNGIPLVFLPGESQGWGSLVGTSTEWDATEAT